MQLAANRLEDVCREALQSGVIAPARPSIGTHARRKLGVRPVFKRIDSCAAEFDAATPYLYSTYEAPLFGEPEDEAEVGGARKVMIGMAHHPGTLAAACDALGHAGVNIDGDLIYTGFSNGTMVALRKDTGSVAWSTSPMTCSSFDWSLASAWPFGACDNASAPGRNRTETGSARAAWSCRRRRGT